MDWELRKHYIRLVEFLGQVLGPDYEVVLYSLTGDEATLIAIANGDDSHKAGEQISISQSGLLARYDKGFPSPRNKHYVANYRERRSANTKAKHRSSSLFIKNHQSELVGVLKLHFNDAKFVALSQQLLSLCHPDALLSEMRFEQIDDSYFKQPSNDYTTADITQITQSIIEQATRKYPHSEKLNKTEKLSVIAQLNEQGVFLVKGAIPFVAKQLSLSEASVYRYISELE